MSIEPGEEISAIVGAVSDQSELLGLIDRVANLGLELVSINLDERD